ncbi:MAG: hypothetical protein FWE89_02700 [Syntrophaceae bacterium]|nr:hypothetical protein [Syntrophaceae bacterium]
MFLEESDLSPIREHVGDVAAALTTWRPKITAKGVYPVPPVNVEGRNYASAVANMNNLFLMNFWGDGLPLTPPTEELVKWICTGTDLSPDTLVAKVDPRGAMATVHSIAVNLAMTGGRPEYMPVLIAIIQAITDPKFELPAVTPSTNSNYIGVVVNGPMAREIRLGSGYSCVGPDSAHPAGQVIGRALALIVQNIGGAIPGIGAMELYGGMRTTNAVFAEDEEGLPADWPPLSVERGFKKGENTVTVLPLSSAVNVTIMQSDYSDVNAAGLGYLHRIAGNMRAPNMNVWSASSNHKSPDFAPGLVLLPRTWAQQWSQMGWSKGKLKEWLRENTAVSWADLQQWGLTRFAKVSAGATETKPVYMTENSDQIRVVVAGGAQSAHAYWMQIGKSTNMVSRPITLPAAAKWSGLIKAAENDLGAIPAN